MKIVTIGGGSSYTPELAEGLLKRVRVLPVTEYWLVDIEEGSKKQEINAGLIRRMAEKAGVKLKVRTTLNREEALNGAAFVTTQLRVGGLDAREKDERIPLSHGMIGQETNGAGGLFKALRTIPVMLEIARDMLRLCPDAWLINFTNPSGMVTEALLRYSPFKRVIGLCNVPIHMERSIAQILDVEASRIHIRFAGLNHLVYGKKVFLDGIDITQEAIEKAYAPNRKVEFTVKNVIPVDYNLDFIKALGMLLCPYHNYYYKKQTMLDDELKEYQVGNTRAQAVKKVEQELFEVYQDEQLDVKPKQLEDRGGAFYSEAACRLIESIYTDKQDIQPVDTRNNGAIAGIEDDSAVEVSCIITREGPIPLTVGKMPLAANGLIQQIKTFERLTVEAACEGSYEKALLALCTNPLTDDEKQAKVVLDELFEAHKEYLPLFFEKGGGESVFCGN